MSLNAFSRIPMNMRPVVWTIAGSDSSGLAGIEADIKALEAHGCHAGTMITAITAQGLKTGIGIEPVSVPMLRQVFQALSTELPPVVIKIGMLATREQVVAVAAWIKSCKAPSIYDPVLATSGGMPLATEDILDAIRRDLLPVVDMLTPNLSEAERLIGSSLRTHSDMLSAGTQLISMGPSSIVIKGGHGWGSMAWDAYVDQKQSFWLGSPRHPWTVRGTGCTMASLVAAHRAHGLSWSESVVLAKAYMTQAIANARSTPEDGPRILHHDPRHSDDLDLPIVSYGPMPHQSTSSFRPLGAEPIGFYPIFDRSAWIPKLAKLGVTMMQLRIKDLNGQELAEEISEGVSMGRKHGVRLFINDHWELALRYGAYGVHLGQEDLISADINTLLKSEMRLGISTHSYEEAAVALSLRPSYIALGPIFETTCKSMNFGPHGLNKIATWARLSPIPLVAIGGLRPEHIQEAKANGAKGVAAIADWLTAQDPFERVRTWVKGWHESPCPHQ